MKLNDIFSGNFNAAEWEAKGYQLPKYDIAKVREKTAKEPTWVHFGGGNIFRAFPAAILNDALNTCWRKGIAATATEGDEGRRG